jgi:hypothetical protein
MLNWDRRETKRTLTSIRKNDGTPYASVEELHSALMDELANGYEVLPLSDDCDSFDFKTGCPGHDHPATT